MSCQKFGFELEQVFRKGNSFGASLWQIMKVEDEVDLFHEGHRISNNISAAVFEKQSSEDWHKRAQLRELCKSMAALLQNQWVC